jgi:hypothetical protein
MVLLLCVVAAWPLRAEATVYDIPPDTAPGSINSGDIINLSVGGILPDSYSLPAGSVLNVNGGQFGPVPANNFLQAYGEVNVFSYPASLGFVECHETSVLNVFGGSISAVSRGGEVNVDGGTLNSLIVMPGTEVNVYDGLLNTLDGLYQSKIVISGGMVDTIYSPYQSQIDIAGGSLVTLASVADSVLNMSAGVISGGVSLGMGAVFNLSGGSIPTEVAMSSTSELNIFGRSFLLNGVPIPGLTVGDTVTIAERDIALTGSLLDGSGLLLNLSTLDQYGDPNIVPGATITVTLVPEPTGLVLSGVGLCVAAAVRRRLVA